MVVWVCTENYTTEDGDCVTNVLGVCATKEIGEYLLEKRLKICDAEIIRESNGAYGHEYYCRGDNWMSVDPMEVVDKI